MDFAYLNEQFVIAVVAACLVVGYIIKTTFDFIPNKYIPTIVAILGAILNAIISGVTVEAIIYGSVMGLASTGMHQAFKNFVENNRE